MKRNCNQFGWFLIVILLATGCRSTPDANCERAIAMLRAENIDLENKIYEMQARYEAMVGQGYSDPWSNSNQGSTTWGGMAPGWQGNGYAPLEEVAPGSTDPVNEPEFEELPEQLIIEGDDLSVLDRGLPSMTGRNAEPRLSYPAPNQSRVGPPTSLTNSLPISRSTVQGHAASQPGWSISPVGMELAQHVQDVAVDCDASGARDRNSWLIIQPLDRQQNALPIAGQLEFAITSDRGSAGRQQVGRWRFSAAQVSQLIRDTEAELPGVHLPLPAIVNRNETGGMLGHVKLHFGDGRVFETTFALDGSTAPTTNQSLADESSIGRTARAIPAGRNTAGGPSTFAGPAASGMIAPVASQAAPIDLVAPANVDDATELDGWSPDR